MQKSLLFLLLALLTGGVQTTRAQQSEPMDKSKFQLCNKNATRETQRVFDVLKEYYGTHVISGACCNIDWNIREAENVYKWTGRWPALTMFDFMQIHASKDVNPNGWMD